MEIDPSKLAKLREMSEAELSQWIRQGAKSMGMGTLRASVLAASAPTIKKKLASLSDQEIEEAVEKIGAERVRKLLEQVEPSEKDPPRQEL